VSNTNVEEADAALVELYPPTSTALYSLERDKRILLLHAMLLLLLSLEHYTPHSRILLLHIASSLHVSLILLQKSHFKVGGSRARELFQELFQELFEIIRLSALKTAPSSRAPSKYSAFYHTNKLIVTAACFGRARSEGRAGTARSS
jgi:hypothetical protein